MKLIKIFFWNFNEYLGILFAFVQGYIFSYAFLKSYGSLTILISQSGETADTLAALRKDKERGIDTLGIINTVSSSIARESLNVLYIKAGAEISVATTKAYSAQVLMLELIALVLGYEKGNISKDYANSISHGDGIMP